LHALHVQESWKELVVLALTSRNDDTSEPVEKKKRHLVCEGAPLLWSAGSLARKKHGQGATASQQSLCNKALCWGAHARHHGEVRLVARHLLLCGALRLTLRSNRNNALTSAPLPPEPAPAAGRRRRGGGARRRNGGRRRGRRGRRLQRGGE
jgi:hypothetical protein